jgi:CBS domain-containing protein
MGFTAVHDLVGGRVAWTVLGLPTDGEVADRRRVGALAAPTPSVPLSATVADLQRHGERAQAIAVVSDEGVLLGAVDTIARNLPPATPVEGIMIPAPATIRPDVRIDDALEQLRDDGLASVFVTTARGVLVGIIELDRPPL